MKSKSVLVFFLFILYACSPVLPPELISLNRNVDKGIEALKTNALDVIKAWEEVSLAIIDRNWQEIYANAEQMYLKKQYDSQNWNSNPDQKVEIAALAGIIKDKLEQKVREKATEMRQTVNNNHAAIEGINDQIVDLLSSAQRVIETNESSLSTIQNIVPIPIDFLKYK